MFNSITTLNLTQVSYKKYSTPEYVFETVYLIIVRFIGGALKNCYLVSNWTFKKSYLVTTKIYRVMTH